MGRAFRHWAASVSIPVLLFIYFFWCCGSILVLTLCLLHQGTLRILTLSFTPELLVFSKNPVLQILILLFFGGGAHWADTTLKMSAFCPSQRGTPSGIFISSGYLYLQRNLPRKQALFIQPSLCAAVLLGLL
jgi:hypothetical protein